VIKARVQLYLFELDGMTLRVTRDLTGLWSVNDGEQNYLHRRHQKGQNPDDNMSWAIRDDLFDLPRSERAGKWWVDHLFSLEEVGNLFDVEF
jgi:hypothetical protein